MFGNLAELLPLEWNKAATQNAQEQILPSESASNTSVMTQGRKGELQSRSGDIDNWVGFLFPGQCDFRVKSCSTPECKRTRTEFGDQEVVLSKKCADCYWRNANEWAKMKHYNDMTGAHLLKKVRYEDFDNLVNDWIRTQNEDEEWICPVNCNFGFQNEVDDRLLTYNDQAAGIKWVLRDMEGTLKIWWMDPNSRGVKHGPILMPHIKE